jgi:hypothetical protein
MHRQLGFAGTLGPAVILALNGFSVALGASLADDPVDVVQTADEALAQDLALIAKAQGWTLDEVELYHRAEQAIGQIATEVAEMRPDVFVGSALSLDPGGPPTLFIKGPADSWIRDLAGAAGIEVVVADMQPYSFDELEARKVRVHDALRAFGIDQVVTRVNIAGAGVIPVEVTLKPGFATTSESILSAIPDDLRSSVELTIHEDPIVVSEAAFGGMTLLKSGFLECTSGWTVQQISTGIRGISSAGHCVGVNMVAHTSPSHNHATTFKGSHEGQWGDVEWYTTNQAEADDFYSESGVIRDVGAVEPRNGIAVNEAICVYGRASNDRDCSLRVLDASIACGALDRLVQMNGDTQIGGDSGGGWSFDTRAYGGHFGNCAFRDSFTVADLFDEALGVFVPTT